MKHLAGQGPIYIRVDTYIPPSAKYEDVRVKETEEESRPGNERFHEAEDMIKSLKRTKDKVT